MTPCQVGNCAAASLDIGVALAEVPTVPLEVGRLVSPFPVERVLDLHGDVGTLGHRVGVVSVDVVYVDHHLHGRVAGRARAVDAMDLGIRVADHHDAVPDS